GGTCFVIIGSVNKYYFKDRKSPLLIQLVISCLIITVSELLFGLILNIGLGLDIWDYSDMAYNFLGQICLRYSLKWFLLSIPAIVLYDYLNYWLFGEKKPDYKLI